MRGARAHVQGALDAEEVRLDPGQRVCRVLGNRGNHVFQVEDKGGQEVLCLLPAKFHKKLWIKTGSFVVVDLGTEAQASDAAAAALSAPGDPAQPARAREPSPPEPPAGPHAGGGPSTMGGEKGPGGDGGGGNCQEQGEGSAQAAAGSEEEGAGSGGRGLESSGLPEAVGQLVLGESKDMPPSQASDGHTRPKIRGVIVRVLFKQQLRALQLAGLWRALDAEEDLLAATANRDKTSSANQESNWTKAAQGKADRGMTREGLTREGPTSVGGGAMEQLDSAAHKGEGNGGAGGNGNAGGEGDDYDDDDHDDDDDDDLPPLAENTNRAHHARMFVDNDESSGDESDEG